MSVSLTCHQFGHSATHTQTRPESPKYVARSLSTVNIESSVLKHRQHILTIEFMHAYSTPVYIPVPPRPQIALPTMSAVILGAAPHMADPISKIRMQEM